MKIVRLKAKNFLALGEVTLTFDRGLALIEGVNMDEAYSLSNGCLAGDTLIDIPRDLEKCPGGIPLRDLVGSKPVVYGMRDGKIIATQATRVWQTGSAEVVRVRFGRTTYHAGNRSRRFNRHEEIVGTADHLVMLVSGVYKPLGKLKPGDRLMPMYRRLRDGEYTWLYSHEWGPELEHRVVGEFLKGSSLDDPKNEHVHHRNGRRLDNRPENLEPLPAFEHLAIHGREKPPTYDKHPRGMSGKHHRPEIKRKISRASQGMWNREREKMLAAVQRSGKKRREANKEAHERRREELLRLWRRGLCISEIAQEMGAKYGTVWGWLRRYGITKKPNHEVVSVESLGRQPVYDMEVPETSNFVANGVVVHNSGKSSLIEALFWGLYGKTIRDGLKDDVVNDRALKKCSVEVILVVDGKEYKIRRGRKPNTLTLKCGRNALEISNGEKECWQDMTCHIVKETEKLIARIVGMPSERFLQTILLEGGMKAAFAHLTDTYRKQFLEEILGLQVWEKFQKATLWASREAAEDVAEFQQAIDLVKQRIGDEHRRAQKFSESSNGDLVEEAKEKRSEIAKRVEKLRQAIERTEDSSRPDIQHEHEVYESAKAVRDEGHGRVVSFRKRLTQAESKLHELESLVEQGRCPTCGQEVLADDFRDKLTNARETVRGLSRKLDESEEDQQRIEEKYEEARTALDRAEQETNSIDAEIRSLKREKKAREDQLEEIEDSLRRLSQTKKATVEEFQQKIEELKKTMVEHQVDLKKAKKHIQYTEYWRKAAPEIRAGVMRSVLEYLNGRLELYSEIVSDRDEVVQLVLDGSKIIIETRVGGKAKKHSMRSSGERRRTDLSIQFALNDLAVATGGEVPPVLIVDEVLDPLDPISAKRTLDLLSRRAVDEGLCVLVTTHNPVTKNGLPSNARIITVEKRDGRAHLI